MCIALISAVLIFFTGVLPANQDSQTFVQQQREQQFKDLKQGLTTLRRVQDTDSPELTVLKLYLLEQGQLCLLYTSPSPRDISGSRMPSSA